MDDQYKTYLVATLQSLITPLLAEDEYSIDVCKEADQWRINIDGIHTNALIDDSTELLRALQHILRVKTHKQFPHERTHFILDIDKYRQKREHLLKERVKIIAETEVLNNGLTLILVRLSSYERRLIHNLLVEIDGLETTSVGQGSSRKLLIRPTSELGSKSMESAKVVDLFADQEDLRF